MAATTDFVGAQKVNRRHTLVLLAALILYVWRHVVQDKIPLKLREEITQTLRAAVISGDFSGWNFGIDFAGGNAAMLRGLVTQHCKRLLREQAQLVPLQDKEARRAVRH